MRILLLLSNHINFYLLNLKNQNLITYIYNSIKEIFKYENKNLKKIKFHNLIIYTIFKFPHLL